MEVEKACSRKLIATKQVNTPLIAKESQRKWMLVYSSYFAFNKASLSEKKIDKNITAAIDYPQSLKFETEDLK